MHFIFDAVFIGIDRMFSTKWGCDAAVACFLSNSLSCKKVEEVRGSSPLCSNFFLYGVCVYCSLMTRGWGTIRLLVSGRKKDFVDFFFPFFYWGLSFKVTRAGTLAWLFDLFVPSRQRIC